MVLLQAIVASWSLDSLINVLHSSPAFQSIRQKRDAWVEKSYQCGRLDNPAFSMELEEGNYGLFLEQEIPNPLRLKRERDLWRGEMGFLEVGLKSDSFSLIIMVKSLYWNAIYTRHLLGITGETIVRLDSIMGMVERGHRMGRFPITHVLAVESKLNHYRSLMEILKSRYRGYLEHLSALLDTRIDSLEGSLSLPSIPDMSSMPVDSALPVMEAGASARISRYRKDLAGYDLWRISIYGGLWNDPATGNRWYSAGISLPIPLFNTMKGEARYWEGMSHAYRLDSLFAVRRVKGALKEFQTHAGALVRKIETVEEVEIPLARRMYREALRNYMKGGSTYLEVLDALEVLHEKEVERADYIMNLVNMCMELEAILGRCIRR